MNRKPEWQMLRPENPALRMKEPEKKQKAIAEPAQKPNIKELAGILEEYAKKHRDDDFIRMLIGEQVAALKAMQATAEAQKKKGGMLNVALMERTALHEAVEAHLDEAIAFVEARGLTKPSPSTD